MLFVIVVDLLGHLVRYAHGSDSPDDTHQGAPDVATANRGLKKVKLTVAKTSKDCNYFFV